MKPIIVHQQQPCPVSCVVTSIAMLTNKPVDEVKQKYHDDYRSGKCSIRKMLDESGLSYKEFGTLEEAGMVEEGAYLATVPSLNIRGGNHSVVFEVTEDGYFILDPVEGREGRFYYISRGNEHLHGDLAVVLNGYQLDAFISRSEIERVYSNA